MKLTKHIISKKKFIGIFWAGEFGHLIMTVIPRINKIRQENPDAYIVLSSYQGDHIYFRDSDGAWTIDEYIDFPWWPVDRGCHEVKGNLTVEAEDALRQLIRMRQGFDGEATIIRSDKMSLADYTAEFKRKPVIAYPFKDILGDEPKIADGNHFVIMSRAKNYGPSNFRSWNARKWRAFLDIVLGHVDGTAYVCGVKAESVDFPWSSRVIDMTEDTPDRSAKTLNLLSNARFCIGDCSGSSNYAIQCGTPTFVSGPKEYEPGFMVNRNYFGAYVRYQSTAMGDLTPTSRIQEFEKFLANYRNTLERNIYEG